MLENLPTYIIIILAVVIIGWLVIRLLSRSYIKTTAATAFVRTGGFQFAKTAKPLVVVNGAAWVFGFLHRIKWVSLETMAIQIAHVDSNALITHDPQYVDLEALFFIRVGDKGEHIGVAARTIGGEVVDETSVIRLVKPKIDGAVRDVAATFALSELMEKRIDFINRVEERLQSELEENGLMVENVSILVLRPTLQGQFSTDDILGAQVARANAAVIEDALTAKNRLEKTGFLERARQDAEAEREHLGIEEEIEKERAERSKNVAIARSSEETAARIAQEEKRQEAERARILADRSLKEEELTNEQQEALLREQLQKAIAKEKVLREEAIAIAEEERQVRVAEATAQKLAAVLKQIEADSKREQALQEAMTLTEKTVADREAEIELINTRLEAEKQAIENQSQVERETLRLRELAEAERSIATAKADAIRIRAEAELEVARLEAEGDQAKQSATGLAEVQVQIERLKMLEQEAEVIKQKLLAEAEGEKARAEALASNDAVAKELELARLNAEVMQAIEIARAQALGEAISGMNMNLIGDASMAQRILQLVTTAQSIKSAYNVLPPVAQDMLDGLANRINPSDKSDHGEHNESILQAIASLVESLKENYADVLEQNPNLGDLSVLILGKKKGLSEQQRRLLSALAEDPNLKDVPLQTAITLAQHGLSGSEEDDVLSMWL